MIKLYVIYKIETGISSVNQAVLGVLTDMLKRGRGLPKQVTIEIVKSEGD